MNDGPMIRVENLRKAYDSRLAVEDFTFQVAAGEVMGFVGPNGAGKTTTLRIIAGILPPSSGRVWIGGSNLAEK
ncbi:MAG: ATP-binding cassette domain-containing protein, partial [Planctomycetota bacterium]|nr:ATP-binding cassette domain-containing protein [Planctomycetota bacterium]